MERRAALQETEGQLQFTPPELIETPPDRRKSTVWTRGMLLSTAAAIVITFAVTLLLGLRGEHTTSPDSNNYLLIAAGHSEQAVRPFANRVLDANVVRVLATLLRVKPDAVFPIVGAVALALLISVSAFLLQRRWAQATPWLCIALLCEPWLVSLFQQYYFPDLRHAALVAVFFLLLPMVPNLALFALFLLFLTRESTILLSMTLIAVYVLKGQRRIALKAAIVSLFGIACQIGLASSSQPNVHGINGLLYTLCKIPNNIATNIFGLKFVYNTYSYYPTVHPILTIDLPRLPILHNLHQAALVDIDYRVPLQTLLAFLTAFGVAPVLMCFGFKKQVHCWRDLLRLPTIVLVALTYGVLSTVAAPTLGNDVPRYLSYAWPMFVIAGSYFVQFSLIEHHGKILFVCQILLCWLTCFSALLPALAIALSLQFWALRLSQREPVIHEHRRATSPCSS